MTVFPVFDVVVLYAIIVRFCTQSFEREGILAKELRYQSYGFNGLTLAHELQTFTTIRDNENHSLVWGSRAQYSITTVYAKTNIWLEIVFRAPADRAVS